MYPLRLSTASQEVPLGYFVDSTDGNTEETGLTIANTDIKLHKNGATTLANKNSGGATHISNGIYYTVLDATDTNTIGPMVIFCHVAGALAVRVSCIVYPAEVFDYLYAAAGTDYMKVDIAQVSGSNVSTTTAQLGVNAVQAGGTAWGSGAITAASIASNAIADTKIATGAITSTKFAASAINAAAIATDAIAEAKIAADAVTKIQTGLATPTNITAGTITTVTNLTNAPTNGDLTATMKTSVTTAATAATPTAAAVTGAVGSVTGAVGSVTGNVGGNVTGSIGSLAAQAKADVNAEVVDALQTDTIPDSYAADGSQPTIVQAILAIQQFLTEKSVSGTTVTVKKPDGSTTAMTLTLDSGTSPTSITRAT